MKPLVYYAIILIRDTMNLPDTADILAPARRAGLAGPVTGRTGGAGRAGAKRPEGGAKAT